MSPSNSVRKQRILFMMSGSIAAFKACALLSKLVQAGYEVQVVASSAALQFVGSATLEGLSGKAVLSDIFEKGHAMDHIHAVRWADLIVVVPASAHFINRIAQGVGDDLLTTMFLAHDFKKPFLIAPAMNTAMYLHPATQASLTTLKSWGLKILEAASGVLACGEQGYGRLLEPVELQNEIEKELKNLPSTSGMSSSVEIASRSKSKGLRVLVTAGGTIEPLDGVRVLANESTGHTAVSIAKALDEAGADVTLLASENALRFNSTGPLQAQSFKTFRDLSGLMEKELANQSYDFVVHAAAVSDYRLSDILIDGKKSEAGKIPSGHELQLNLVPNPKIIDSLKAWSKNKNLKVLGFKFTENADEKAKLAATAKLFTKGQADFVLWNDTRGLDRKSGRHEFEILNAKTEVLEKGQESAELAPAVFKLIFETTGEKK